MQYQPVVGFMYEFFGYVGHELFFGLEYIFRIGGQPFPFAGSCPRIARDMFRSLMRASSSSFRPVSWMLATTFCVALVSGCSLFGIGSAGGSSESRGRAGAGGSDMNSGEWMSLFDGKTLAGWRNVTAQLGEMPVGWQVVEGGVASSGVIAVDPREDRHSCGR